MWEVIAAVLATAIGIVVLPFFTSLAGNWLDDRRSERSRRRQLYEELLTLETKREDSETIPLANEIRAKLYAQMGPRDIAVRRATGKAHTYAATREENDVMRWWVFGYEREARKLAKRIIAASSTSQEE